MLLLRSLRLLLFSGRAPWRGAMRPRAARWGKPPARVSPSPPSCAFGENVALRALARRSASRRSLACPPAKHNPRRGFHRGADYNARACKPGSVVDGHLSRTHVAARLKPPPSGRPGRPCVPFHGVAPDRVYSAVMSPCGGRALISAFPPLPRRRKVRSPPFPRGSRGLRVKTSLAPLLLLSQ